MFPSSSGQDLLKIWTQILKLHNDVPSLRTLSSPFQVLWGFFSLETCVFSTWPSSHSSCSSYSPNVLISTLPFSILTSVCSTFWEMSSILSSVLQSCFFFFNFAFIYLISKSTYLFYFMDTIPSLLSEVTLTVSFICSHLPSPFVDSIPSEFLLPVGLHLFRLEVFFKRLVTALIFILEHLH